MNTPPSQFKASQPSPPVVPIGSPGSASNATYTPICSTPRPVNGGATVVAKGIRDDSLGGTGLIKTVGSLTFSSAFDSANLKDVQWNAFSSEHELFVASDCHGTPHQTRNSSWFHFSVRGLAPGQGVRFRVMNSNRQPGLYRAGFKPVIKSMPSNPNWQRLPNDVVITDEKRENGGNRFEIAFTASLGANAMPDEIMYIAMTYPYGYDECQADLQAYDQQFATPPPTRVLSNPPQSAPLPSTSFTHPQKWGKWVRPQGTAPDDVFWHRELLCRSLDGRRVDLITISDWSDLLDDDSSEIDDQTSGGGGNERRGSAGRFAGNGLSSRSGVCESHEHMLPHASVFPEVQAAGWRPHAPAFRHKKVVFLTARVHPGETPASHCLNGSLELLLHPTDLRAVALRKQFVFKVIPILNPDGVARGHYRQDNYGRNLNRYYSEPSPEEQPTIYATKEAVRMHAFMPSPEQLLHLYRQQPSSDCSSLNHDVGGGGGGIGDSDGSNPSSNQSNPGGGVKGSRGGEEGVVDGGARRSSLSAPPPASGPGANQEACLSGAIGNRGGRVALYLDMHAHATKRGCFIYGNSLESLTDQVENQLYAQLLAVNSAHFEYHACNFSKAHMERIDDKDGLSATGSGRVAMHLATGAVHSYTLECNYNTGTQLNHVPAAQGGHNGAASPERSPRSGTQRDLPKYSPAEWGEVGRGALVSILDLHGLNPWPRLNSSKYRTLDRARDAVCSEIRHQKPYQKQSLDKRRQEADGAMNGGSDGSGGWSKARNAAARARRGENNASNSGPWSRAPGRFGEKKKPTDKSAPPLPATNANGSTAGGVLRGRSKGDNHGNNSDSSSALARVPDSSTTNSNSSNSRIGNNGLKSNRSGRGKFRAVTIATMTAANANKLSANNGAPGSSRGTGLDGCKIDIQTRTEDKAPPTSPVRRIDHPSSSEPSQQQQVFEKPSMRERPLTPTATAKSRPSTSPAASNLHPRAMVQKLAGFGDGVTSDRSSHERSTSGGSMAGHASCFPPVAGATAVSLPAVIASSTPTVARPGFGNISNYPGSSQEIQKNLNDGQNPLHQES